MMDAVLENFNNSNYTYFFFPSVSENDNISEGIPSHSSSDNGREESFEIHIAKVIDIIALVISIFGAVGNGIVIWLLGFRIKRNPFMTYILNLAVADFGGLLSLLVQILSLIRFIFLPFFFLAILMNSASLFLMAAISIDRCVAVFFPLWHQCKRPPRLSTIVCALIWVLSVLLTAITITLAFFNTNEQPIENFYQFIVNVVLCLPVMTIATVSLFIKVCLKEQQRRRGRLLTIVLLTLLFFLLFTFPANVIFILAYFDYLPIYMASVPALLDCLNSSVNPFIYFLVGRPWKSRRRESMRVILQKVFKEEKSCTEETPAETQL
ncbi:LOW QUALITY PROTEIN: mas-related G-protein coupled receptor member H-like [Heteronotia binoei]|uniref:LOW QUALITY PROTEIN: mas-related G-protein coupled receptor member H-like n=1 Tax=Heteronotia binoei TaxID=13085 RepID=UPI0029303D01|nr:LOW QUALITY PROTEIN: mas-related G-protein coupled receptor member H-like [Heteronotia binoei]